MQAQRGNTHVFLCTKPQAARFFGGLGFWEIARVEDALVFMENRRDGFSGYCAALAAARRPGPAAAAVMHANPFTLGHLHLVERAAADYETVYLFVLSEEASPIPFAVRQRLVREGTAHLPQVICRSSGPYLISAATFPSYFLPDGDAAAYAHGALDVEIFRSVAACLDIRARYAGEEPTSRVTGIYNEIMARRLPELGIRCRIIPRMERDGRPVSASTVRQAIHDGELNRAMALLPPSGRRYFASPEAAPVIVAIQAQQNVIHH